MTNKSRYGKRLNIPKANILIMTKAKKKGLKQQGNFHKFSEINLRNNYFTSLKNKTHFMI